MFKADCKQFLGQFFLKNQTGALREKDSPNLNIDQVKKPLESGIVNMGMALFIIFFFAKFGYFSTILQCAFGVIHFEKSSNMTKIEKQSC